MTDSSIAKAHLFSGLSSEALDALREAAHEEYVARGEVLLKQGDPARALFFVQAGRFKIVVGGNRTVAYIDAGEVVGELAFFAGGERTADVVSTRDSLVLKIDRDDYDKIAGEYTEVPRLLLKLVSERLAQTTLRTDSLQRKVPRVIGVMPTAGSAAPIDFIDRLAEKMQHILGPERPVEIAREADTGSTQEYSNWLAEHEADGGFVLVDCSGDSPWQSLARRNIDSLLLIAEASSSNYIPSTIERATSNLIGASSRRLVLVRDRQEQEIEHTGEWLSPREVGLHHHLALDSEGDFSRLARFLCGQAVGLILAGGGALGCAHLGVVKALVEAGVPIDFYSGTSVGAAMAGAIATGMTADETLTQMEEMFVAARALKRLTIPVHSLLDPSEFDHQLRSRYGDRDIADLPSPFFAVSTNLSTSDLHIHHRGPMWEAIRASGSLPTILPPFIDNAGNVLVDGGVLDNLPVRVMETFKQGPNIVIALDALDAHWHSDARYENVRGRLALLRDIALRRKPADNFPTIFETTQRAMVVTSRMASREIDDDNNIVITAPQIAGMQILDWHKGRELAELSQRHTEQFMQRNSSIFKRLIGDTK